MGKWLCRTCRAENRESCDHLNSAVTAIPAAAPIAAVKGANAGALVGTSATCQDLGSLLRRLIIVKKPAEE